MEKPLNDVRVVTLEQAVAAPLCTRRLQLAGAEVIKIERPEGDFARHYDQAVAGQSAYFVWLNAGKKSVVLDLKVSADKALLLKLIQRSDVLVQNLKPGALDALGLGLDGLHAEHPGLISVSISGFAPDGPGARRKAYDLLMQAESGLAAITGSPQAPGRVGVSVVDLATGMYAYEAVLEALLVRAHTGKGSKLDVALFDAVAEWLAVPYLLDAYADAAPQRVGLAHPGICPYGVFAAADGRQFVLSIQNEREWQRLVETALDAPELMADARCRDNATRVAHRDFVDGAVQERLALWRYAELAARLDEADVAFAPLNGIADLKLHPDFHTQEIDVGGRSISLPRVPGLVKDDGQSLPALGEHTEAVRSWLESTAE